MSYAPFDLGGRVAVVFGGTSGIGRAIAHGLAEAGAHVVPTSRRRELLLRTPMGRFGRAQELAGAAVFLASEASSFVTGEIIAVDGGFLASGVNR